MKERFSLIDFTTNPAGDTTQIDEPMGWDGIALHIMRDKVWHGFFNAVDDTVSSLQFVGTGHSILKAAYELKGIQADVKLLIEFQCAEGDAYQELYYGQFVFAKYKAQCGDLCLIECGVEAVDCMMQFRNRYDQQVDLDSLVSFAGCPCENTDNVEASMGFVASLNTIRFGNVDGSALDFPCLKPNQTIIITGTGSNDGTYTIVTKRIFSIYVIVTVVESVIDESPVTANVEGCLLGNLEIYTGLNFPVVLPSKIVQLKNEWGITPGNFHYVDSLLSSEPGGTVGQYIFPFDWDINVMTEINDSDPFRNEFQQVQTGSDPIGNFFNDNTGILKLNLESALRCIGDTVIDIVMSGQIDFESTPDTVSFDGTIEIVHIGANGARTYYTLQTGFGCAGCNSEINAININTSISINMQQGDRIYLFFIMANVQYTTGPTGVNPFELDIDITSASIKITTDTACEQTICNVYKINEVMSRCVEAYTDDCMRVYSDYFGRTDAQPYPSADDGCGGQRSIANGKKIRNAPSTDGVTPIKMTVSMKDTFDALNATDNIGMGLEADPNRPGNNLIRVEPVHYFFNDAVLMTCASIIKVTREVDESIIYSIYKGGYDKWETWNDNGLYDLFGDREYRTELSQLKNTLAQTCRWLASDYAIEFTRRLYGTTTSDWKYDDDIFFLCFKPCWTGMGGVAIDDNSFFVIDVSPPVGSLHAGDVIVITGSSFGNDGTYTIAAVTQDDFNYVIFQITGTFPGTTGEDTVTICNTTATMTIIETGIDSPSNILFPETVLNYRIAPSRNAMRWVKTIFQSYRDFINGQLIFTQGGGNILGQGLVDNEDGCRLEDEVIQEQEDLMLSLFIDPAANYPNFYPELITFAYPMSYQQYLTVIANPYGLIGYQCGSADMEYGWIEDMKYTPYTGMVIFTLRPKIEA